MGRAADLSPGISDMKPNLIVVRAAWDEAAGVWVAQSDDIGLVTEAATLEALREKVPAMIVDLLECDGESGNFDIPVEYIAHSSQRVRRGHAA